MEEKFAPRKFRKRIKKFWKAEFVCVMHKLQGTLVSEFTRTLIQRMFLTGKLNGLLVNLSSEVCKQKIIPLGKLLPYLIGVVNVLVYTGIVIVEPLTSK